MIIYNHVQGTPSDTWTIEHNLGSKVSIEVRVEQGDALAAILPHEVIHLDDNTTKVTFSTALAGNARVAGSWKFKLGNPKLVYNPSMYDASDVSPLPPVVSGPTPLGGTFAVVTNSTLSNSNNTAAIGGSGVVNSGNNIVGQVYAEVVVDDYTAQGPMIGVAPASSNNLNAAGAKSIWITQSLTFLTNGDTNSSPPIGSGAIAKGSKVGMYVDMDAKTIQFYKDGAALGAVQSLSGSAPYHVVVASPGVSYPVVVTANFVSPTYTYP